VQTVGIVSAGAMGSAVGAAYLAATIGYGLAYIAGLLVLSVLIFSRRDFK